MLTTARTPVPVITFLKNTWENFHHTGAVAPSSPWLAKALAAPLAHRSSSEPLEILEAGPGTGALTAELVRQLRPGDHLTLCEINACFVSYLEERFRNDVNFKPWAGQVTVHHGPVEELNAHGRFHHIVSGLPFNNFDPELVQRIFQGFEQAVRPGGTVSFFEYACIRLVKARVSNGAERTRLRGVEAVLTDMIRRHEHDRKLVLFNVPPAWACCLKDFGADRRSAQAAQPAH